jgi:hypothetical protein
VPVRLPALTAVAQRGVVVRAGVTVADDAESARLDDGYCGLRLNVAIRRAHLALSSLSVETR